MGSNIFHDYVCTDRALGCGFHTLDMIELDAVRCLPQHLEMVFHYLIHSLDINCRHGSKCEVVWLVVIRLITRQ